jgi:hypothetical protein
MIKVGRTAGLDQLVPPDRTVRQLLGRRGLPASRAGSWQGELDAYKSGLSRRKSKKVQISLPQIRSLEDG